MLKRARGTASYKDVRQLLQLWLHGQHMTRLVEAQNRRLYEAARERDRLIAELRRADTEIDRLIEESDP